MPLAGLLSQEFAAERARADRPGARRRPVAVGRRRAGSGGALRSTTHLTVADADGMVVSYTFTIESTGGNGIVVPGWGFLLNNELTDFDYTKPTAAELGRPAASGRARRSRRRSCSATASRCSRVGSPGGSTIITTVLQILLERFDLGKTLPQAIAAPRAAQRNGADDAGRAGVHRLARGPGAGRRSSGTCS